MTRETQRGLLASATGLALVMALAGCGSDGSGSGSSSTQGVSGTQTTAAFGKADSSPACIVDPRDTVGAGDAFVAGYLSGLLGGLPISERLVRANACGALLCMSPGDWEASPSLAEVSRFCSPDGDPVSR